MRRAVAATLIVGLVCPAAFAKRKKKEPEPVAEVDPKDSQCPDTPPYGFVLEKAWASGSRAEALQAARDKARAILIDSATAGYDDLQRAAVIRNIRPWKDGLYIEPERKGEPGSACAAVAIRKDLLNQIEGQYGAFADSLDTLAAGIREQAGDQPLVLQPPRWSSGCPSSELGQALAAQLKLRLVGTEIRKTQVFQEVVAADEGETEAPPKATQVAMFPELWLELAPRRTSVTLSAQLREPSAQADRLLGGFEFPSSLFGIEPDERGVCHDEAVLGLERGRLVGADGLTVQVNFPTDDGVVCEGQKVPWGLATNMPAQVWLFSVAADGQAWFIWPVGGASGQVNGVVDLGTMDIARLPEGGDERFVAVALPRGTTWGATQGWSSESCRLPVALDELTWPAGTAIGSEVFTVASAGQGDCPAAEAYSPEEMLDYLSNLPECGR